MLKRKTPIKIIGSKTSGIATVSFGAIVRPFDDVSFYNANKLHT